MSKKLYKALESIALGYSEGSVSVDVLIKACDNYKLKTDFEDDFDYQIIVAKSCFDCLNGVEPDKELNKAIMPGQTRVIDGVMYIYSPTKVGSRVEYDWHVVQRGTKTGKDVGRGSKLDSEKIDDKQKFVNSLFPKDLSSLKPTGQNIGGSTGAQLMEDVNGNKYIVKRGKNTNNGHVQSEYLTNQLYDILGLRVPDYELYDDNGEAVILSKFIPMCKTPGLKDHKAMAQGFIADCLLANWDVYQNDNCLVDPAGRIIRVDNGGCLDYRARGTKKTFDDDILGTFKSMIQYNQSVYSTLDDADIKKQIQEIRSKKDDIVAFLKESGQDAMADIIEKRIDGLSKIEKYLNANQSLTSIPILPRTLKSEDEMYRELSEEELEQIWNDAQGRNGYAKLLNKGAQGWELLSEICKLRGFDARPQVVTDSEYWDLVKKDKSRQFFRGVSEDWHGRVTLDEMARSMLFDDECFYGSVGVYGEGIYAHKNNGHNSSYTASDYKQSDAWSHAKSYATQSGKGFIYKGLIAPDARIAQWDVLNRELSQLTVTSDPVKARKLQGDIEHIDIDIEEIDDKIRNSSKLIEQQVYADMNYDPTSIQDMELEISGTDWDKVNAFGEREIPSYEDFVIGKMQDWVKAQGGTATIGKGVVKFSLPDADSELSISKYQYDGPNSIKKKNAFTPGYNFAAQLFTDWMYREKVSRVESALKTARDNSGDMVAKLNEDKKALLEDRREKGKELKSLSVADPEKSVWQAVVANKHTCEVLGIYAALKGYDAIEVKSGNGSSNNFYVILNRTKLVMSNKIDNV